MNDMRHRHPWTASEEATIIRAKASRRKVSHKALARKLKRTPRSVDQHVARMKERGLLAMHERETRELIAKLEAEMDQPELYPEGSR